MPRGIIQDLILENIVNKVINYYELSLWSKVYLFGESFLEGNEALIFAFNTLLTVTVISSIFGALLFQSSLHALVTFGFTQIRVCWLLHRLLLILWLWLVVCIIINKEIILYRRIPSASWPSRLAYLTWTSSYQH
jgi:hypothetical protein